MTGVAGAGRDSLLERSRELAAIDAALTAARAGDGQTLVIEGPAGIGKTALLVAARAAARSEGFNALSARGGQIERDLGFGLVEQLLAAPARAAGDDVLVGQARLAAQILGIASDSATAGRSGETMFSTLQALYWLTANLSERRPVALLVDDAHLADSASMRFLAYLAQRLEGLPVLMLAATRSGPEAEPVRHALPDARRITVKPLSAGATATLIRATVPAASDNVCRTCFEATGGNAFFVRELAYELERDPNPGVLNSSPERVRSHTRARLLALSEPARELARGIAVLGKGALLRHAAAVAGLDTSAASDAADELRANWILTPERHLEFIHPIVRTAVYEQLAPGARSRSHSGAAQLLAAEHVPPELVAAHLLHCEPVADGRACELLREAARAAHVRGAPEAAAAYLRRALEEPPTPDARTDILLELALAEGVMFDVNRAAEHLRQAFDLARDPMQRLFVARAAASLGTHGKPAEWAISMLSRTKADFAADPALLTAIDADIANVARFELEPRRRCLPLSRQLRTLVNGDGDFGAATLAAAAAELVMTGESAQRAIAVARRGVAALGADRSTAGMVVHLVLARVLITADAFELARQLLEEVLEDSRRRGSVLDFAFASIFRADLMYRMGELFEAEEDSRTAFVLSSEHGWPMGMPAIVSDLVHALVERGELEQAADLMAQAMRDEPPDQLPPLYTFNLLLHARGRLRRIIGDPGAALADQLESGRREELWEEHNPALIPWRSEAALALRALGRHDEARRLAAEEVELARRFGAPRALGIALRVAGVVEEGDEGLRLAREAADVLEGSYARLEHARALVDLGERLRATGRRAESRDVLRTALELSHVCGAAALERQAHDALLAVGARPRRVRLTGPDALTTSERRVAQMAERGMSNREIAEALFVTVRTVEFHLAGAYRKLRIDGRKRLSRALVDGRPAGEHASVAYRSGASSK